MIPYSLLEFNSRSEVNRENECFMGNSFKQGSQSLIPQTEIQQERESDLVGIISMQVKSLLFLFCLFLKKNFYAICHS